MNSEFESSPLTGDDADHAAVITENELKMALLRRKAEAAKDGLTPKGYCYYCDFPLDNDKGLFCPSEEDFSCAHEHHKLKEANERNNGKNRVKNL